MEDVCDNLFNPDPYYQQGGDMVRVGGMDYACAPAESVGKRISDLTLDNGRKLEAGKSYKVAGWASVNPQQGKPVWDVFANYLRARKDGEAEEAQPGRAQRRVEQSGHFRIEDEHVMLRSVGCASWRLRRSWRSPAMPLSPQPAPLPDKPFAEHRSCCSFPTATQDKQALVLSVAYNLLKAYDPDKIAIEVVAFGPGIDLLRAESPNRARVDSLIAQGVQFDVCMNTVDTIERETGKHVDINPKAVKVQVGVGRILELTENGYTLVRP